MASKFLTKEGRTRLEGELHELKTVKRPEIIRRIHEAKEFGELSEGNEPDEVKNDQAFTEGRIMMLERLLREAVVVSAHSSDTVSIGATVDIRGESQDKRKFTIVGTEEIDLSSGKISNESPLGRALVGRKVGEKFSVDTPGGSRSYEILGIT
jgi:transcription elongation factor GreA